MAVPYIKNGRVFWTTETTKTVPTDAIVQPTVTNFAFEITCSGLKPLTRHYFFDGNVYNDKSAQCEPIGGKKGDALVTTNEGTLNFKYYYTGETIIGGTTTIIPPSGSTANATITQSTVTEGSRQFIVTASPQPAESYRQTETSYAEYAVTISGGNYDITMPNTAPVYEGGGGGSAADQWMLDDAYVTTRKVF